MPKFRNLLAWVLLAGGAVLISNGVYAVYPLIFPPPEESIASADTFDFGDQAEAASYLSNEGSSIHSPEARRPDRERPTLAGSRRSTSPVEQGVFVARLEIPRLHATIHVVEGTGDSALRLGAGHLPGTPSPGLSGNSVIAGHRDTHFRVLKDIQVGDDLLMVRGAHRVSYKVLETRIVDPSDTSVLHSSDERLLTLITCYPFAFIGPAPQRFIVIAIAE